MSFGYFKDDNTSKSNCWLESLETQINFPSVLVKWLDHNEETWKDGEGDCEEGNIFIEESFIISEIMAAEDVERRNKTCFLLFGFRVNDERTRRFFMKNWKEVRFSLYTDLSSLLMEGHIGR